MSDTDNGPTYVPRAAEVVWTGPSSFKDVTLHGFVVKADSTLLDEVLDRYIDRPSQELGLRVEVGTTFNRVLFLFVESKRFQIPRFTGTGQAASQGSHHEKLFAIVVFGTRTRPDPAPVAFAPYVYATLTPGWRAEREIFGYPQQLADISIESATGPGMATRLKVNASAIKDFRRDAIADDMTILQIAKKPGGKERPSSDRQLATEIVAALAGSGRMGSATAPPRPRRARAVTRWRGKFGVTAADLEFFTRCVREAPEPEPPDTADQTRRPPVTLRPEAYRPDVDLSRALQSGLRMLFLKEFRDIVFADRACFQAIVEAPIKTRGYTPGTAWVSKDYQLTLEKLDSAPIHRELGVPNGKSDVELAFRIDFDELSIGDEDEPATVVSNPLWNPAMETASPDERSRLPRYVERGGEAVWRQPSMLYGVRIHGFGVKVDAVHQAKILDRYVNDVVRRCDVSYGPAKFLLSPCHGVDMVMLMFVEYERVASGTDDDSRLGGVGYREFLVTQLAFFDDLDFPEINWLIPFIYLDQDSPRLGGREIYGYPKQQGVIPPFKRFVVGGLTIEAAQKLELRATVMPAPHVENAGVSQPVVTIRGKVPPKTIKQYDQAADMILDLLKLSAPSSHADPRPTRLFPSDLPGLAADGHTRFGPGVDVVNALVSGGVGHVFLKQFRDSALPTTPCYQAVCKTDTVPGKFRGGARVQPDAYRITIENSASERLLDYLGKTAEDGRRGIKPNFVYWMDLDVELTTGRVIANSFDSGSIPDWISLAARARDSRRRIRRTGELAL